MPAADVVPAHALESEFMTTLVLKSLKRVRSDRSQTGAGTHHVDTRDILFQLALHEQHVGEAQKHEVVDVVELHVVAIAATESALVAIHQIFEAAYILVAVLGRNRRNFLLVIVGLLNEVSPAASFVCR